MMNLTKYVLLSTAGASAVVYHAFATKEQCDPRMPPLPATDAFLKNRCDVSTNETCSFTVALQSALSASFYPGFELYLPCLGVLKGVGLVQASVWDIRICYLGVVTSRSLLSTVFSSVH